MYKFFGILFCLGKPSLKTKISGKTASLLKTEISKSLTGKRLASVSKIKSPRRSPRIKAKNAEKAKNAKKAKNGKKAKKE
jgi:hypothetical protein